MSVATRLGLATRGLRGGFGETVIVEVPVEVPVNYYITESLDLGQPSPFVSLSEVLTVSTVEEISVDVASVITATVEVSTLQIEGAL